MKLSLEQLSARMRQGETIPSRQTAQVALALSIPSILEQLVVTAMGYIDAAMVGHIGAEATASIGIVSSSTWLLHGVLVGLYTALSIQIAQYLGADRQDDARSVLRQAMLFNVILGVGAALFGLGISPFCRDGWELTPPCGKRYSLLCHLVNGAALHHGHGHVHLHPPGGRLRPDRQPHQRVGLRAGCHLQLLPHQPTGRCGASPSGVPGWVCPAQPWAPPWPLWWAACWLWPSCCCGTAPSASGSLPPGRSPAPACGTCYGWAYLWQESAPPSLWRRWC